MITLDQLSEWYPKERKPPPDQTFEIALVLAGAVSAGAYTAGVLDFLFEALDTWRRKVSDNDPAAPAHNVIIRLTTGASAGGINGAIAAVALRYTFPPVRPGSTAHTKQSNPFYKPWVSDIDIKHFLATDDIERGELRSLLNCDVLMEVGRDAIGFRGEPIPAGRQAMRDWIANPLQVMLTVTNLHGVPYAVNFRGGGRLRHEMTLHADYVCFAAPGLSPRPQEGMPPEFVLLDNPNNFDDPHWHGLAMSALATGAFPLALEPRLLTRPGADYDYRHRYLPPRANATIYGQPAWPNGVPETYDLLCVDGGVMDNEPFELARIALAGTWGHNPREGTKANRAVILVDPFSEPTEPAVDAEASLPAVAAALLGALKQQARFKPIDLSLAQAEDIYSRYLIAPSRGAQHGSHAIASGGLGAFFGFFSEACRHHDFMLGRRNCQRFLTTAFTLPHDNPLFKDWNPQNHQDFCDTDDPTHRQIIPLMGHCTHEEPLPDWPGDAFQRTAELDTMIERRVDALYRIMRDRAKQTVATGESTNLFSRMWRSTRSAMTGAYLSVGWKFTRSSLLKKLNAAIDRASERLRNA